MMRPVTVLALILGATALGLRLFVRRPGSHRWPRLIGLALTVLAVVAFVERFIGYDRGLSRFAFHLIWELPPTEITPWMAPNGCLAVLFIGLAFSFLPSDEASGSGASQWMGVAALITSFLALLGYFYGVQSWFLIGPHMAMAAPSAIAIGALAVGAIGIGMTGIETRRGPLGLLLAPSLGGYALRRLLPAIVMVPPAIGWLLLRGERFALYEFEFEVAIFATANVIIFSALIIAVMRQMVHLEHQLVHQREINRTILETAPAALFLLDADNRITLANREVQPLLGWTPAELQNQSPQERFQLPVPENGTAESPVLAAAREGRALRDHEEVFHTKDGRVLDMLCATAPLRAEDGTRGAILLALNITVRKQAQRELLRSEERFAIITRITNDAVWDWDLATDTIWWNRNIESITADGSTDLPETVAAWEEHIHPDDREQVVGSIYGVIESGGREWAAEYRYRRSDGSVRFVIDRGAVIRDEHGRPVRMLGGITDITERKRVEESLHLAVRRFETLANLIPQFIWSTRPDGYHDYFNERWYEFTGMPREGDQGWNWKNYLHPDDFASSTFAWEHSLKTGEPYQVEYRVRRARDGLYVWFIARAVPIRDPEGRITRWFGTCTDIEDQRRAGEKLEALVRQRTAQLRESVADLEHFSYTLTHDMRAPLRAMQGYAHMLLEEHAAQIDAEGTDYLRRIMSSASRMDHLILDALNYSKVVKTELTLTPIETGPLLRGLIESYPEFQSPRAEIVLIEPLPVVQGNVSGLTQCFSNLLINAVKFVRPGEQPRVRVWSEDRDKHVCLWFEDNGIGIPPAYRERIFRMFERLNPAYEGTGVGLALVRKVTERMRGRVGVEPGTNGGSRFWIELLKG